ncbi:ROK family protein [Paracoccus xiamenensis]|uniref:ROK family protein n=1 Tax=Paracoccus xiamenensis TaxID=2714901 RepID=UPI0014096ABE|nr:ROK family protein [Paracoccus xiamenensis]NHF72335.1 ROK family protein [Paracoccus xiamenensis]
MREGPENTLGVDVGGTHIRVARIARDGTMHGCVIEAVRHDRAGFSAQLLRLIDDLRDPGSVAVGIGIPGRVEGATQRILSAGYLDIAGLDLPRLIADHAGLPARVENDATMALIAEAALSGHGVSGLILMVTIGTGIGGAALLDGRPWHGGGIAGQFGHIVVEADGPACKCGRRGCVETLSSGTALGRLIAGEDLPPDTRAAALLARAEAGDPVASAVLADWAEPLRRALETLVAVADPKLIVIGGGVGAEMVAALARLPAGGGWFGLPVTAARLGDNAGVIGAGLAAIPAPEHQARTA